MNSAKNKIKPETIITSHINADFDAVASMLAAHKLYPDSVVIFPGSQEKNLRDFFISSMSYLFNMESPDAIDFSRIKKLVVVDTRQAKRLSAVSELLQRDDMEIHIYDHHPNQSDDIKGTYEHCTPTGATITILSRLLREKKINITPEEATVMALGIYEDTGSFTFASTTEADFTEAAFLLSCGANLNTIASLVIKEISTDQVTWLNDLLNEMTYHRINGFDINISTISSPTYITDLASIVQKVMKIENLDIFFAIVLMEYKITIVARSKIEEADVGRILSFMGGGGHPYAASAVITNKTLAQVEQQLLTIISKEVHAPEIVRELMSSPPIIIDYKVKCRDASKIMTRYNVNALLISRNGNNNLIGYITRQVIEKILYHNLDHLPVEEYMSSEISFITMNADIGEIENKIIDGKQRILPIMEKGSVTGVITRTDLLNFLVTRNQSSKTTDQGEVNARRHARKRNIKSFMQERLSDRIITLLQDIGRAGDIAGVVLFVVGGFVRDLMLYRESYDIDIVVEGDGIAFAKLFASMSGGRCNIHKTFGTAVIVLPDGFKIDVASARLEYYKFPAALPTVEMSSIKLDLFRRDFTINTLAIRLNENEFGTLTDFFGAQRDLKDKTIRIIHNLSFVEDPTRVFRAIKFANRFDFTIGKLTSNLIKNAVKIDFFKHLSGLRVFSELKQILEEENPISAIVQLKTYSLEKVIHPEFILDNDTIQMLESVKKTLAWHDLLYFDMPYLRWAVYFMVMIKKCSFRVSQEICSKFNLPPKHQKIILKGRFKAEDRLYLLEKSLPLKQSALYNILSVFKTEHILYMMAIEKEEPVKKAISLFYTQLKDVALSIRGRDIMNLGIQPGPRYKDLMQAVLDAKLDGVVETKEDEIKFVSNLAMKNKHSKENKPVD